MLTDSAIRAAKPKTGQTVKLSDGGGLQLWVQPSGSKLWNLAYRFAGKQRKLAIGSYPGIGLKEARALVRRDRAAHAAKSRKAPRSLLPIVPKEL
jgi:Arm DNA-binding domain